MSMKKKVTLGVASIAVGAFAVMGGTFAYFSSETASASTFSTGTLIMSPNETYLEKFNIVNFKPGDKLTAVVDNQEPAMMLNNQGSLPFNVFMNITAPDTTYDALKDALVFEKLYFGNETDGDLLGGSEKTLREVIELYGTGDAKVNGNTISGVGQNIGYLDAAATGAISVKGLKYVIRFNDTGEDQNDLQNKAAGINFGFTALQYDGVDINSGKVDNGSGGTSGGGTFERNDDINARPTN
ncbi:hypothetical protein GN156_02010 [bacterium LRH843]|nr:hypothetical protein [bacterium LRH843]